MHHLLETIDFGEIDGYGDPNLEKYFLDNNYWSRIVENPTFFVIGKKGTGKSAIYRMIETQSHDKGAIISNKDFGEFPFEKLLQLSDSGFAKPNQYQTIWKSVILNLLIQNISKLPEENSGYFNEIVNYYNTYLKNANELHKEIISKTSKRGGVLHGDFITLSSECSNGSTYTLKEENITRLNSKLEELIINFLLTRNGTQQIIIQFDRLDDNYNQYQDTEEFFQSIISLFKVVYSFNQTLRAKAIIGTKVIVYLRSDILRELSFRDSESARWYDFCFELNWNIAQMKNYKESDLYKMIMKRVLISKVDRLDCSFDDIFEVDRATLKKCGIKNDLFAHLILQTLFRPRDLLKLCKTLQAEILASGKFTCDVYNSAIKKYANWLVNTEIANEINPILKNDYKPVLDLLRMCGSKPLTVSDFAKRYAAMKYNFAMTSDELLKFLYSTGLIENTWQVAGKYDRTQKIWLHRSIFRNEGEFDRNLNFKIFDIIWSGLTV